VTGIEGTELSPSSPSSSLKRDSIRLEERSSPMGVTYLLPSGASSLELEKEEEEAMCT